MVAFDYVTSKIANTQRKEKIMYLGDSDNYNPAFTKADVSIGVRSDDRLKPKLSCTNILKFDVLWTFLKRFMENNFLFSDNILEPEKSKLTRPMQTHGFNISQMNIIRLNMINTGLHLHGIAQQQ